MGQKYYHNIDLIANELLNGRLHNITTTDRIALGNTLSIISKGYMVYDTDLLSPYFWDGTAWQPAGGITTLNGITSKVQYFQKGTVGTDFDIDSLSTPGTHIFNLPVASATNTGKLSNTDYTTFTNKASKGFAVAMAAAL